MNRTERTAVTILLTLCALSVLLLLALFARPFITGTAVPHTHDPLHIAFFESLLLRTVLSGVHALVLLAGGVSVFIIFRKSNYPEFIFYTCSMISFAGISVFNLTPLLTELGYPAAASSAALRLFMVFWCLGTCSACIAGLFPNGVSSRKQLTFFLAALSASVIVSVTVPLDSWLMLDTFPFVWRASGAFPWAIRCIGLLGVLNFAAAAVRNSSSRYFAAAGGLAAMLAGNDLFFIPEIPAAVIGSLLIALGTALYSMTIYREYMWT